MNSRIVLLILILLSLQCRAPQKSGNEVDVPLENTYWKLVEVGGNAVSTPANGREVYMTLSREDGSSRLKGHAGCNGLGGDYRIEGRKISFQPITTRMYCESQMEVENLFTGMLSSADSYRIFGETLELYSQDTLLGRFDDTRCLD